MFLDPITLLDVSLDAVGRLASVLTHILFRCNACVNIGVAGDGTSGTLA